MLDITTVIYCLLAVLVAIGLHYTIPILLWFHTIWRTHQAIKHLSLPIKYHWLLGNVLAHPGANEEGLRKNREWTNMAKDGKVAFYVTILKPQLGLVLPHTAKALLQTAEPKQITGFGIYKLITPWLGKGLLVANGAKWARNRKLLTPGFHFDILKNHIAIHNDCSGILMEKVKELSVINGEKKSIDIVPLICNLTLDIIVKCVFSTTESLQVSDTEQYLSSVEEMKKLMISRYFKNPIFLLSDFFYFLTSDGRRFRKLIQLSHDRSTKIICDRRDKLRENNLSGLKKGKTDFLDILLLCKDDNGKGLTDQEILDEVETFMFEGHDTTSSAISLLLYNLAKHPEYQEKARQEVLEVVGDSATIEWEHLPRFHYLTMCIKESLRMYPPVPFIGRELSNPLTIDDVSLPAGASIEVPIYNIHHNEKVWGENHMTYDPERFSEENVRDMDPFAFVAFSAGPRNCIGQNFAMNEIKIVVGQILKQFHLKLDEDHEVKMCPGIILQSETGLKLSFEERLKAEIN